MRILSLTFSFSKFATPTNVFHLFVVDAAPSGKYQEGNPGSAKDAMYHVSYDSSKSVRILGLMYRTKKETVRDTLADWEVRGW